MNINERKQKIEQNKEHTEIIFNLKSDTIDFDEQRFLEFAKKSIENLCEKIKDGNPDALSLKVNEYEYNIL